MKTDLQKMSLDEAEFTHLRNENLQLRKRVELSEEQLKEYKKTATETSKLVASVKDEIQKMNKRSAAVEKENNKLALGIKKMKERHAAEEAEKATLIRKQRNQLESLKILCRNLQCIKSEQEKLIKLHNLEESKSFFSKAP